MDALIKHTDYLLELIDDKFPNQRYYAGIMKKIYDIFIEVRHQAKEGILYDDTISYYDLVRLINEEYSSNDATLVIVELENIEKIMRNIRKGYLIEH